MVQNLKYFALKGQSDVGCTTIAPYSRRRMSMGLRALLASKVFIFSYQNCRTFSICLYFSPRKET